MTLTIAMIPTLHLVSTWGVRETVKYLRTTQHKHAKNSNLGRPSHGKTQKDPKRQRDNEKVRHDGDTRCNDMEPVANALDTRLVTQGEIPVCCNWPALEECSEEDGNGVQSIEDIESVDSISHVCFVAAESEKEDKNGCFDEGQNRVVEHLHKEIPPKTSSEVEVFWHVVGSESPVVEFYDY
jgi:hypothetical protein